MKRIKAILLLLLASFCLIGSLPLYWLQMRHVRREMKARMEAGIPAKDLEQFEFELVDGEIVEPTFAYCEHGKEFSYRGNLYDIFKSEQHGNKILIWAVPDDLEMAMLSQMLRRGRRDDPMHDVGKTFLKFFGKSFPHSGVMALSPPQQEKGPSWYAASLVLAPAQDILIPPPQA